MTKSFFFFRLIIVSFVQETRTRAGRRRGARAPEGDRDADRTSNDGETVDRIPPGLEEQPSPGKARLREGNPGGPEGISPGPEAGAIINNLPPGGNPPPQPPRNNPQAVPIPPRQPQPGCIDAAAIAATIEGMRSECERYFISGTVQGALHTALHATYHISRTLHHVPHNLAPHTSYHVPRTTYTCQACQQGHKQQYL